MKRIKNTVINLSLSVVTIIATLFIAESILRFTTLNQERLRSTLYNFPFPTNYFKKDPVKGFDIRENFKPSDAYIYREGTYKVWSNEIGCFDTDAKDIKDYILLVGDSFTHSYAKFEDKWGTKVEDLLGYRVLKCGVPGYGTRAELYKAQNIIARILYSPKIIIVGYYVNDLQDDYLFPEITVVNGVKTFDRSFDITTGRITVTKNLNDKFQIWKKFGTKTYPDHPLIQRTKFILRQYSIIYDMLYYYLNRPPPSTWNNSNLHFYDYDWIKIAWEIHYENIRAFRRLAEKNKSKLLIVIIPAKYQVYLERYKNLRSIDTEKPNRILHDFFKEEGIDYIDLLPDFKQSSHTNPKEKTGSTKELYWEYDNHWNKEGNYLAGLIVSKYILKNKLLDIPHREKKIKNIERELSGFFD